MNMCIFAAPMIVLYLVSIAIAWFVHPAQRRKRAEKAEGNTKGTKMNPLTTTHFPPDWLRYALLARNALEIASDLVEICADRS